MNTYPQFFYYIFTKKKKKSLHTEYLYSGILVGAIVMMLST